MFRHFLLVVAVLSTASFASAKPRTWTSANGAYKLEGELIGSNDTTAILKRRGSGRLAAVELQDLSDEDREFVTKLTKERSSDDDLEMHTWTSREGLKIRARILAYGKKEYTLDRKLGAVTINGKAFSTFDPLHQKLILRVLSVLEDTSLEKESNLNQFVASFKGQPKSYTLEGVLMELASGDQIAVPFFMFSEKDLEVLQAGWENWKKYHEDDEARARENLMMRSEASHYQQSMAQQQQRQQLEVLKFNMAAVRTGLTSIWEVRIAPNPGVYGRPTSVMVSARDSLTATQMVLPNYPGYFMVGVRKFSY
ncbi:MAG: SHD1 domain-containing protein [Rhodopirellula sp. JB055]|uniref:SHD1 domain-containing protein n=1 Tax=Rhodopirellula sp. JB055 TaxID=3342846 RepID=UPI00370B2944